LFVPSGLKDDGSTACGGWMYCGVYPKEGHNQARSRKPDGPGGPGSHLGWAFAWPSNRRTLYNRASADPDGKPWSERKKMVWWDEEKQEWTGLDTPDFVKTTPPTKRPDWSKAPLYGMEALSGAAPFIMEADGLCELFVPSGLKDGPLPTHYEPIESPVPNTLYPGQRRNPAAKIWERPGNELNPPGDPRFPYVLTTFRLTELQCGGIISRVTPHTAELQPEPFVELPPELAEELGIEHLGWTVLSTLRGEIEMRAMVTQRLIPFEIEGRRIYQIGIPWVFGWDGYAKGDIANVLLAITGDPNTSIHTTKALTCNLRPGRLPGRGGVTHHAAE
ncbi:MAG: formate dehydrogenase, partial [Acetobacteraceae bacterium]|nr:formate dehydrogenase [Acetobacteraceae bacterium]